MEKNYSFEELLEIVEKLRSEDGCPWDREQTHDSIKQNIIEEGYELVEALEDEDFHKMADESGDLLLQVIFHAQIGKENNEYSIDDVINAICRKLIHRHPHVFGEVSVSGSDEVLDNWSKIKREERGQKTVAEDMEGVSKYLPSLMRAEKIQSKAEKSGYVFNEPAVAAESISNMINILAGNDDTEVAEKYIGKMLFELAAVAKGLGVDAETALNRHTETFIHEFAKHEE